MIIDEKSHNTPAALEAAQRVRDDGINMIVVGVEVSKICMIKLDVDLFSAIFMCTSGNISPLNSTNGYKYK